MSILPNVSAPTSDSSQEENNHSGVFITFEGIDGCGKTTQIKRLDKALISLGLTPLVTREPGGTAIGDSIRAVLLSSRNTRLVPMAELLLMASDRAQHVAEIVRPALKAGNILLCDRYTDSTLAFQGYGRGVKLSIIDFLNRAATGDLTPDLTILLDLDPVMAQDRLNARPESKCKGMTRFDDEAMTFHEKVREGYIVLSQRHPDRIRVVDAAGSIEETHSLIVNCVTEYISSTGHRGLR